MPVRIRTTSFAISLVLIFTSMLVGGLIMPLVWLTFAQGAASALAIDDISPTISPNNFDVSITITGTGFDVVLSGTQILTAPLVYLGDNLLTLKSLPSNTKLEAVIPWGLEDGIYSLRVENVDGISVTLNDAFTVTAALGVWTTGGPFGGSVHALGLNENISSTIYAQMGQQGLFKSIDAAQNWVNIFPGVVTAHTEGFQFKPGDPDTIYLTAQLDETEGLFRSTNGGQDWQFIRQGAQPAAIGVSPGDPEALYFVSESQIAFSADGGDSWISVTNGIPPDASIEAIAVHPISATIAYVGLNAGRVYSTTDGGQNWAATGANFGAGWWRRLAIDPFYPNRLYATGWHDGDFFARSLNHGTTWQAMILDSEQASATDLQFHPALSGTIYAMTSSGIFSTTDSGADWNKVPISDWAREGWSLLLHPQTGLPFFIGHNGKAVLRSENGGIDWQIANHGLTGLQPHELSAAPADPRQIYLAAGEGGGFVSSNGGQSWLAVDGPEWAVSVATDPLSPTVAYIGDRRDVYHTTNGGQSWTSAALPGLPEQNDIRVHAIAVAPLDSQTIYAGAGNWDFQNDREFGYLYRSQDAGLNWNPLTVTLPISAVTDILIDPADNQTIYVATGRRWYDNSDKGTGILKSTDGGATWAYANQGLTVLNVSRLAIDPVNPNILYAGTNAKDLASTTGIFKSLNGGQSWSLVATDMNISGLQVDPLIPNTIYAGLYWDGMYVSTDGGQTWQKPDDPLGRLSIHCLDATMALSRTLLYAGVSGGMVSGGVSSVDRLPARAAAGEQFYGSGVYQFTIDRRKMSYDIFLPVVIRLSTLP